MKSRTSATMKSRTSAKRAGKRRVKDLPVSAKAKDTTGGKDTTAGKRTYQGFGPWEL